jgi:hypothetical protein
VHEIGGRTTARSSRSCARELSLDTLHASQRHNAVEEGVAMHQTDKAVHEICVEHESWPCSRGQIDVVFDDQVNEQRAVEITAAHLVPGLAETRLARPSP